METYSKVGRAEQDLKWARIWFKQFSVFHHRRGEDQRPFTADEVVALLRNKRDAKVRISEAMRLRVKDIDFANKQIEIRDSKFGKSRLEPMPDNLIAPLERWVASREVQSAELAKFAFDHHRPPGVSRNRFVSRSVVQLRNEKG